MTSLFGVPLCGTLFVPLVIGAASVLLFWMLSKSKKRLESTVSRDELHKSPGNSFLLSEEKPPREKKKSCGENSNCCGKKDGKSGSCSDKNKVIEIAKVFVDTHSNIAQEFASVLSSQLSAAKVTTELILDCNSETVDLSHHVDGSLCIFLTDISDLNGEKHWLHKSISCLTSGDGDKPLTGMKYTVFIFQSFPSDRSKVEALDQLLHKSGAIRLCKAESTDLSSAVSSSHFDDWADELFAQVQRWNTPNKKACKCGPKKKIEENDESCGSKCSDSEEDTSETLTKPVLDLEDIAKLL
ncbi:uncharacterized protein LOC113210904 isoform X1 [Frankliniella occidentalis]|uniref:Uncharacterized protein LOC113210904 isoform X1 n=1 Tax=Frankliniella occidentalis TaxID=133901 RepID=A0A6J1SZW1_FRAOC|nr:uncharacterized protein LOC113210904 isoform X1 [Frankliniella occidentalis]